ncbi:MAG TPA: electron transfer flavoprotein subunit beta/FixA family protein [Planctomycetota bacterium]|jgi:electron transfer flavoprotein beta subunit|nr:electron transfer flavoprotein subunit beta/FixA family protein [Planctomycetota bacterium]
MNLAVCLKRVPDTTTKVKIGSDGKSIDPQGVEWAISPYDELAIELALRLKEKAGGETVGITVDPDGNDVALRKALAIGLDKGVLIKGGANFDGWVTAQVLATALKGRPLDVILFGKQAIDDDGFQVPTLVAQILGLPRVNVCTSFEVEGTRAKCRRQIEGGEEQIEVSLPCVISVQKGVNGIHDKRFPSMKGIMAAKSKPVETITAAAFESSMEIVKLELPPERPPGKIVGKGVEAVPELVRLLKEEAKVL